MKYDNGYVDEFWQRLCRWTVTMAESMTMAVIMGTQNGGWVGEWVDDLALHKFWHVSEFHDISEIHDVRISISQTRSKITEFLCTRISGTTGLSYCEIHACTVLTISKENKNTKEEETDQFAKPLTHGVSDPVYNFDFSWRLFLASYGVIHMCFHNFLQMFAVNRSIFFQPSLQTECWPATFGSRLYRF